jgi:4-amino-4-deoxy-L-arabinose transferase-like glycosyltransferase
MQRASHATRARPRASGGSSLAHGTALFGVAFALRAAYAWLATGPGSPPYSDGVIYDGVAWNLARGAGFVMDSGGVTHATAFPPPLLPWITSLLYRVVGHDYFAGVLLQCAIGALVPLLVAGFAGAMFGSPTARWAGWITAVHPLLVFISGVMLTESLFCATMMLALIASVEWVKTPRAARALGVGLAWGLASLARPTGLSMTLVVAIWAWVPLGLTLRPAERLRQVGLVFAGLALCIAPWTLRNLAVLHAFVPITTREGCALMTSNNAATWDDPARRGGADNASYETALRTEFRGLSEVEIDRRAHAAAVTFVRSRLREAPAVALAKLGRFWRIRSEGGGTGAWAREGSPTREWLKRVDPLLVWSLLTWPFALWGLVRSLRGPRRWFQTLPLLVLLHFTAIALLYWGSLRMRIPAEPMIALLIAVGVEDARRRWRARSTGLRLVPARGAAAAAHGSVER